MTTTKKEKQKRKEGKRQHINIFHNEAYQHHTHMSYTASIWVSLDSDRG
jgi:hypothetical protein